MNDIFLRHLEQYRSLIQKEAVLKLGGPEVARFKAIDYLRKIRKTLQQESWEEMELSAEDENPEPSCGREISRKPGAA